jgi:hypothetical protein
MIYLKGTLDFGLIYNGYHDFRLTGYIDSCWDGSVYDRKSISGCCFSLGSSMISWNIGKQSSIVLNTIEVKYILACSSSCES